MKICKKCKIEKDRKSFYKDVSRKDGLCSRCKECDRAASLAFSIKHKEILSKKAAERYAKNKESESLKRIAYYAANRDKNLDRIKSYQKKNPWVVTISSRNRRARVLMAEGEHSHDDVVSILQSQRSLCATCEKPLFLSGKNKYHVDHIFPISKGGSNCKYNIQCLCPKCNFSKGAKSPEEWASRNNKLL